MRIIIAGSRNAPNSLELIEKHIMAPEWSIDEIVSGMSGNVDLAAVEYARKNKIKLKKFYAQWGEYGRAAGPIRNEEMALYADGLLAIWDRKSRGTEDMIDKAMFYNLDVYIVDTEE